MSPTLRLAPRAARWLRGLAIGVGLVALCLGGLYLVRHPLLAAVGDLFTHVDPIEPSDAIVVLSGGEDTRPFHAAELYASGVAPLIVMAEEELTPPARLGLTISNTEVSLKVLRGEGVPDSAVLLLKSDLPVTSTREEAEVIRGFVERGRLGTITVVTSPFHTARARYTLRKALEGVPVEVRMAAAPEWRYDPARWWETEAGIVDYGMEVLKWIHTLRVLE